MLSGTFLFTIFSLYCSLEINANYLKRALPNEPDGNTKKKSTFDMKQQGNTESTKKFKKTKILKKKNRRRCRFSTIKTACTL